MQSIAGDHELAHAGIEAHFVDVFFHLFQCGVQDLQFGFRGGFFTYLEDLYRVAFARKLRRPKMEQVPEFFQEAAGAFDASSVPRLALLDGA